MAELLSANWNKVSYMVELIVVCLIFLIPARKRENFPIRAAISVFLLLLIAWTVNTIVGIPVDMAAQLIYWPMFLVALVPFVWSCMDGTVGEAVYCVACASATQHVTFNIWILTDGLGLSNPLFQLVIYLVLYALAYRLAVKHLISDGKYIVKKNDLIPIVSIVFMVCTISVMLGIQRPAELSNMLYRISDSLCCIYILWGQARQRDLLQLQKELDGINYAWTQQKAQYQVTQETIETINRKCHDLRYQIRSINGKRGDLAQSQYLKELESAVMIYDTAIKTGNEALDVVLMEKELFCTSHQIQMTCMVDGSQLSFMEAGDIYAMFGNALDNAISAVMELEDPLKRVITMKMVVQDQLIMVQIQNYYHKNLQFQDGLPKSTQPDSRTHGYGMKSMRYTAEKYNGTMNVQAEDGIFDLKILLPASNEGSIRI